MPVMDGLEATKRIREIERNLANSNPNEQQPREVIIGLSANSDDKTVKEALICGMDDFLSKPLSISALKECFQRVCQQQQRQR